MAHAIIGFLIGGVFGVRANSPLSFKECKEANVPVNFGQRKLGHCVTMSCKEGKVPLVLRFQVKKSKSCEV
jgi:hypothetical protein